MQPLFKEAQEGYAEKFGARANALLRTAIAMYNQASSHYHQAVANNKREELRAKICDATLDPFLLQMNAGSKKVLSEFAAKLEEGMYVIGRGERRV